MATLKERPDSYSARGIIVRDFRHTHDGGHEEAPHRKKKGKKRPPKKSGCPGNDGRAHIYVWTTETAYDDWWTRHWGLGRYEYYVCCGCKCRKRAPYIRRRKVD